MTSENQTEELPPEQPSESDELAQRVEELEQQLAQAREDQLRERAELTLRQLLRVAEASGLSVVDPAGSTFDPERHQAMSMVQAEDQAPGTVVQVYQKGYVLNERLLRPALVVVATE